MQGKLSTAYRQRVLYGLKGIEILRFELQWKILAFWHS
jgi:hypothetical protein